MHIMIKMQAHAICFFFPSHWFIRTEMVSGGLPEVFPNVEVLFEDLEASSVNDDPQHVSPLAGSNLKAAGGESGERTETIVSLSSTLSCLPAAMQGLPLVRGMRTHAVNITAIDKVQLFFLSFNSNV
jgi:hypothetical protein